jgi:hypothetical protein
MLKFDLESPADVLIVPARRDEAAISTARRDVSLTSAIRYVMERLPTEARSRAVIRTRSCSLGLGEIAAIYSQPGFPAP